MLGILTTHAMVIDAYKVFVAEHSVPQTFFSSLGQLSYRKTGAAIRGLAWADASFV
jgi:hypothetical protein